MAASQVITICSSNHNTIPKEQVPRGSTARCQPKCWITNGVEEQAKGAPKKTRDAGVESMLEVLNASKTT
jgi:hypothetical protein